MLQKVDHIGIVVTDLAAAKRFMTEVLGLPLVREGEVPERHTKMAFFALGNAQIELIELTDAAESERRLAGAPTGRIDHIAVTVDSLSNTLSSLGEQGVKSQSPQPISIGGRTMVFTQPESTGGVVYQFIEAPQTTG